MGYFANSTEGETYQADYCGRCVHSGKCAVLQAHWLYNYDECNKPDSILHLLIPLDAEGYNEECKMFFERSK